MKFLIIALLIFITIGAAIAYLQSKRIVQNKGTIKGVNISLWWDENCTNPLTEIDWGLVEARAVDVYYIKTFYIKSESNVKIVVQEKVEITNVIPANMTFGFGIAPFLGDWTLEPQEVARYTCTLYHINPPENTTEFFFDATITSIEYIG